MSRPGCRRAASPGSMISPPLPSAQLFPAVVATQIVAVLMCAFGILVTPFRGPLSGSSGPMWSCGRYSLIWFTASPARETPLTAHNMDLR
jgi:hypothetical protein